MERIRPVTALVISALAAACRGGGGQAGISPTGANPSCNWAGYVKVGQAHSFTSASGTWIVPAVSCGGGEDSDSSSWTGVGGGTTEDPTLVQAGTDQDCFNGVPTYDAWWEVIPAPSVSTGVLDPRAFPVGAGDQISARVDGSDGVVWDITIHNDTRGWNFHQTVGYTSAGGTAEWIEEAPLTGGTGGPCPGQSPLANFGRASFFNARANHALPNLDLSERYVMAVMGDINNKVVANTSAPENSDAFDVCYGSGNC